MKFAFLFLFLSIHAHGTPIKTEAQYGKVDPRAKRHAKANYRSVGNELDGDLVPLAKRTDWMLNLLVKKAHNELKANGAIGYAEMSEREWEIVWQGRLTEWAMAGRDVGDHPGLVAFIDRLWDKMVSTIGYAATKYLIGDLYAINKEVVIVFRPCSFPMHAVTIPRIDEYRNHFAYGKEFWGLAPIACKYAIIIPCMVGTAGLATFLCTPAGMAGEFLFGKWVAPKLSDRIFKRACG